MNLLIEKFDHKGFTIEMHYSEYTEYNNPLQFWDEDEEVLACWHNRYNIGNYSIDRSLTDRYSPDVVLISIIYDHFDDDDVYCEDLSELEENEELRERLLDIIHEKYVVEVVSLLDHSGLALYHGVRNGWDIGPIGYHIHVVGNENRESVEKRMERSLAEYSAFINGECYEGHIIDSSGDIIEVIDGYIGDYEAAVEDIKSNVVALYNFETN